MCVGQLWWHTVQFEAHIHEAEAENSQVQGHPGLQSEFQTTLNYSETHLRKNKVCATLGSSFMGWDGILGDTVSGLKKYKCDFPTPVD